MMKKLLFFIILSVLPVFAFDVGLRLTGGFSLGVGGSYSGSDVVYTNFMAPAESQEGMYPSFGFGPPVLADVLFHVNDNVAFILGSGFNYGLYRTLRKRIYTNVSSSSVKFRMHYLPVSLGFQIQTGQTVMFRAGAGVTVAPMAYGKYKVTVDADGIHPITGSNISKYERIDKILFHPGLGVYGEAGVDFYLNEHFAFTLSARMTMLQVKSKSAHVLSVRYDDGENIVDDGIYPDKQSRHEVYGDPDLDPDAYTDPDKPDWGGYSEVFRLNSIQILVGINIKF